MPELFTQLLASVGGAAAVVAAAAWLVKARYEHWLHAHEMQLQARLDKQLKRFEMELAVEARTHEVRFAALHEKRAALLGQFYRTLVEARDKISVLTMLAGLNLDASHMAGDASRKCSELVTLYAGNRLYFSRSLTIVLDALVKALAKPARDYHLAVTAERASTTTSGQLPAKNDVAIRLAQLWNSAFINTVDEGLAMVETEFRSILGTSEETA
jgi:hypothetical protein